MSPEAATVASSRAAQLEAALRKVIRGKDDVVRLTLVSVLARGHILIEGVPGVGKTTLGQALARALACSFQRVQFTSDMLPSDVLGISVYSAADQKFEFKRGPVFTNVLLVPLSSPVTSVKDFIAYAKASAGKASYASPGVGTIQHLCGELFKRSAGIKVPDVATLVNKLKNEAKVI